MQFGACHLPRQTSPFPLPIFLIRVLVIIAVCFIMRRNRIKGMITPFAMLVSIVTDGTERDIPITSPIIRPSNRREINARK
jgi:hypothetical protein